MTVHTGTPKRVIKLKPRDHFVTRGINVPGYIWQEPSFKFDPKDFGVGGGRLNERIFESDMQVQSLDRFISEPTLPIIYGVGSAPSDQRAKYFAAFLVQSFLEVAPLNSTVLWETIYSGYKNAALDSSPSLLVISGLTPNSDARKLEKARDLLEKNGDIPRIVIVAGEDPITFLSNRLFCSIKGCYFHGSPLIRRKVETIALLLSSLYAASEFFSTQLVPLLV
jgi:hypothetical protein